MMIYPTLQCAYPNQDFAYWARRRVAINHDNMKGQGKTSDRCPSNTSKHIVLAFLPNVLTFMIR